MRRSGGCRRTPAQVSCAAHPPAARWGAGCGLAWLSPLSPTFPAGADALITAHDFLSWIKQEEEPCVREPWELPEREMMAGPAPGEQMLSPAPWLGTHPDWAAARGHPGVPGGR